MHIRFENFKSYRKAELPLGPLTLMIGANASGKSNALEAFRFLSWLSQGQKLSVLRHRVDDSDRILRGQIDELGYQGATEFTLGCAIEHEWDRFDVTVALRDDELHIVRESIAHKKQTFPLYRVEQASAGYSSDLRVAYNNFARGGTKPQVICTDQIAVMNQLASSAMFAAGHKKAQREIPKTTEHYQKLLSNTLFLDPVPALMRESYIPDKRLRSNRVNLSGVLYRL